MASKIRFSFITNNIKTDHGKGRNLQKRVATYWFEVFGTFTKEKCIEYQVVTGKVEGKRGSERQRQTFLGWMGNISTEEA